LQNEFPLPIPRIPAPATAHPSGLSSTPTPTTPASFAQQQQAQPRARERDVILPTSPVLDASPDISDPLTVVKVPPVAGQQGRGHRRSQSLTANNIAKTWSPGAAQRERKLSGLKPAMGELGEKAYAPSETPPQAPTKEKSKENLPSSPNFSQTPASPTLIRRFGSLFGGEGGHPKRRLSLFSGGAVRDGREDHGIHLDHEHDRAETDIESTKITRERKIQIVETERDRERTSGTLTHSASQPLSSSHRRAATVVDPSTRRGAGHDRRSSAIIGFGIGRASTVKRPSTGTDTSYAQNRLKHMEEDGEKHGEGEDSQRETATDKESDTFKPIYMKGLFRYVFSPTYRSSMLIVSSVWRRHHPNLHLSLRKI
jgi:serine/threonine protein kinase KIN1/2